MKDVWLITRGLYNDFGVNCAFLDRDLAFLYAATKNGVTTADQLLFYEAEELWDLEAREKFKGLPDETRGKLKDWDSWRVGRYDLHTEIPSHNMNNHTPTTHG